MIEFLIVIAIIAILASLLLPALNKARDRNRTTQCAALQVRVPAPRYLYRTAWRNPHPGKVIRALTPTGGNGGILIVAAISGLRH